MVVVLPDPFGTEEAVDRADGDREVDLGDDRLRAEALGQAPSGDDGVVAHLSSAW